MRILRWLLVVAALAVAVHWVLRALDSPGAAIERRIDQLVEDFNERDVLSFADGFTADYADRTSGANRLGLQRALLVLARRRTPYEVELADRLTLELDTEDQPAIAVLEARLLDDGRAIWEVRVHLQMRCEDGAWRVHRSHHDTLAGARPRR